MIWWTNTQTEINSFHVSLCFSFGTKRNETAKKERKNIFPRYFLNLTLSFSSSEKSYLIHAQKNTHQKKGIHQSQEENGLRKKFVEFSNIIKRREKWNIILCYWIWNYVCDMLGSCVVLRGSEDDCFYTSGSLSSPSGIEADGFDGW